MKNIDVSQTISTIANVGVILGIVFLAFELNQNNELMRAEAEYNYLQGRIADRRQIVWDPEYAEFAYRARQADISSEVDLFRMRTTMEINLLALQWEYGQLVAGNLSDDAAGITAKWRNDFGSMFASERSLYSRTWDQFRSSLQSEFVEFFEENVINPAR